MLVGGRFGRLVVIQRLDNRARCRWWLCKCDCGGETSCRTTALTSMRKKSCGCLLKEIMSNRFLIHGHTSRNGKRHVTREYIAWLSMRGRCFNPNNNWYAAYGGRGITISPEFESFERFLACVGPKPKGYSLERINNDGNYEPGNIKWASASDQANNRRTNHLITFNEKTQTLMQWSRETGIDNTCIRKRLRLGWSIHRTLTTPSRGLRRRVVDDPHAPVNVLLHATE